MLLTLGFFFRLFLVFILQLSVIAQTQQPYRVEITGHMSDDAGYLPQLKKPAFTKNGPIVLLDEGHQNASFNRAFGRLATVDGYKIQRSQSKFTTELLQKVNILVIMGPGVTGAEKSPMAPPPAFTEDEAAVLHEWIAEGGELLFGLNGFAAGPHSVLTKLGVEFNLGAIVDPRAQSDSGVPGSMRFIFRGDQFLRSSHKIISGRTATEQVREVVMEGLTGIHTKPEGAVALVQCSEDAQFHPDFRQIKALPESRDASPADARGPVPSPHSPVAIAFTLGKGRVVVLGDTSVLAATVYYPADNPRYGQYEGLRQGDNQQFTLNVMHWLSGLLD